MSLPRLQLRAGQKKKRDKSFRVGHFHPIERESPDSDRANPMQLILAAYQGRPSGCRARPLRPRQPRRAVQTVCDAIRYEFGTNRRVELLGNVARS